MIDGPTIQTASGDYVSPLDPWGFVPNIADIAHALSNLCRFTGHVSSFYSVSQHSWVVSELVPPEDRLAALLHDASEAYLCDLSRPIKHHPSLWPYRDAERALQARIYAHFGIHAEPASVQAADLVALATEKRDLMPPGPDWLLLAGVAPLEQELEPWTPELARLMFFSRYQELAPAALAEAA
jgi:uncharacterized protein